MSTLLVPWLAFPAVLTALSLGCGLLLERISGLQLPRSLVVPCGFAVLALVAQLAVTTDATASLAVPAVVAAAVAGIALALPWRERLPDLGAMATGVATFAAYAAPIVLSGHATFAGYIKLDDDSTLLAITDRAMEHGRSLAGLEPSTYLRVLQLLLADGYPLATFMPIGVGRALVGGDAMWLYQPSMAFMAAMLGLCLYELCGRVIDRRWVRAVVATVSAQAALLYGYALWGGIKELDTAWALPLLAVLALEAVRFERLRNLIPLATICALLFGVLNFGAAVWIAPALLFTLIAVLRLRGTRVAVRAGAVFTAFLGLLALPTIVAATDFLTSNISSYDPIANLAGPLDPLQVAGIWPAGDFRFEPRAIGPTYLLVAAALLGAAGAVLWALRRRALELPLYVVGALASAFALWLASTPWIAGKAFATASPAIPFAALTACALIVRSGRLVEGAALGAVVAGGVVWSNALQYHEAWLGPRAQLGELSEIGERFAGEGPALMTEYQPYGVRHFLRKLDPEGASELRFRPVRLLTGRTLDKGLSADIDAFALADIHVYRTLVLRRSPLDSRPPSSYRLAWRGRWYEVWQRVEASAILEHLPLGDGAEPSATPRCDEILRLGRLAGSGGVVAAVPRPGAITVDLARASRPADWRGARGSVVPAGDGTLEASARVPAAGSYGVWLGGSFRGKVDAEVDGRRIGSRRHQLNTSGQFTLLGTTELTAGTHTVTLRYGGADLRPGSGGPEFPMGPLVLSSVTAGDLPVTYVPSSSARMLCGKRLDWVEALAA